MPKVTGAIAGTVMVAVLLLAGCSAPSGEAGSPEPAASSSAPLVAESPSASADEGEQAFLDYVRENLPADTVIPDATDEQLLAAGAKACEVLAGGDDTTRVSLIEGEPKNGLGFYTDSGTIITGASMTLCR